MTKHGCSKDEFGIKTYLLLLSWPVAVGDNGPLGEKGEPGSDGDRGDSAMVMARRFFKEGKFSVNMLPSNL